MVYQGQTCILPLTITLNATMETIKIVVYRPKLSYNL